MPIVSAAVARDKQRGNGRREVRFEFRDHEGNTYTRAHAVGSAESYNPQADLPNQTASMSLEIAQTEINRLETLVSNGGDPATFASDWVSDDDIIKITVITAANMRPIDLLDVAEFLRTKTADLERILPNDWQDVVTQRDAVLDLKGALSTYDAGRREV